MKNKTVLALFIIFAQFLNFAFLDAGLTTSPVVEDAFAQEVSFPYVHTFSISAYYSPCLDKVIMLLVAMLQILG